MKKICSFIVLATIIFLLWYLDVLDAHAEINIDYVDIHKDTYQYFNMYYNERDDRRLYACYANPPDGYIAVSYYTSSAMQYYNPTTKVFIEPEQGTFIGGFYWMGNGTWTYNRTNTGYTYNNRCFYNPTLVDFPQDTNMYVFSSNAAAVDYFDNGIVPEDSYIPTPSINYNPLDYEYDSRIEAPVINFNASNSTFNFVNGSSDLGVVAFCRWLSVQDITLDFDTSFPNASGALDFSLSVLDGKDRSFATYSSVVKNDFSEVIKVTDVQFSDSPIYLYNTLNGPSPFVESFNDLLSRYPASSRNIGGSKITNPLTGSYFTWFQDASDALRTSLTSPRNSLSVPEIYFRYYQVIDNQLFFSKWTKFTMSLNMDKYTRDWTIYQDNEYGTDTKPPTYNTGVVDSNDTIVNNTPVAPGSNLNNTVTVNTQSNTIDINLQDFDWSQYIRTFQNSLGLFANFATFVRTVFTFLPEWMIVMLGSSITLLCGLAIYHGIRG